MQKYAKLNLPLLFLTHHSYMVGTAVWGHFRMQTGGTGDQTTNFLVSGLASQPPGPQMPTKKRSVWIKIDWNEVHILKYCTNLSDFTEWNVLFTYYVSESFYLLLCWSRVFIQNTHTSSCKIYAVKIPSDETSSLAINLYHNKCTIYEPFVCITSCFGQNISSVLLPFFWRFNIYINEYFYTAVLLHRNSKYGRLHWIKANYILPEDIMGQGNLRQIGLFGTF